jgi:hypothetical protein
MHLITELGNEKCYGILDDFFLIKKKTHKKTKANIAMAAAIASKARIRLYKAQLSVLENEGRLLYSDTDSIFAAFKKNKNIEDKLLGEYVFFDTTKKDTQILDAVFISSKTYALVLKDHSEIIKFKGINLIDLNFKTIQQEFFSNKSSLDLLSSSYLKKNLDLRHLILQKSINLQDYHKRI